MSSNKLTSKEYWDNPRNRFEPYQVESTELSYVLDGLLPVNNNFSCVEIGAYPGTNLCYLAKKFKYFPTAIDYSNYCDHIEQLFKFNNINDYKIINEDFFKLEKLKFDVVSSYGFIEHFEDYETVIGKHFAFLKPGGYLILSVPYLGGLQGNIRRIVYTDDAIKAVWSTHNTKIMNLPELKSIVLKYCKDILFADYVMGINFWVSSNSAHVKGNMRWLVRGVNFVDKAFGKLIPSSRFYSPMILIVAKNNG